jgi:hypothetical protein
LGFTNWPVILRHQLGPIKFSGTIITAPSIGNNKKQKRNHSSEHKILTWKTLSNKER